MATSDQSAQPRALLLDISGVLYQDGEPLPGALAAVQRVQGAGLPLRLLTNTSRQTGAAVHAQLCAMGFTVTREQVYTAPAAVLAYLRQHGLRPYLLIHPELEPEFAALDCREPDAVVVCDAAHRFDYDHLNRAFQLLAGGAPLIAVGDNRYYRGGGQLQLDAGPFIRALEYAADTRAIILGKPAAAFFHAALAELGAAPAEALMVGDDVEADVIGALDAGLQACLVQTGKYRPGDEARAPGARLAADVAAALEGVLE